MPSEQEMSAEAERLRSAMLSAINEIHAVCQAIYGKVDLAVYMRLWAVESDLLYHAKSGSRP